MNKEELFETLGNIDGTHVTQAERTPPKKRRWKILTGLAACLVLIVGGLLFWRGYGAAIPLSAASEGVTVKYGSPLLPVSSQGNLMWLTEEELFTYFDTAVFMGTVTQLDNIMLDFNGSKNYRALAQIQVEKVYRGSCQAGDTVTVLLPCPIQSGIWVEDTGVVASMEVGTHGIFMPIIYTEASVRQENGATLALTDIADYGFADGVRYAFLETEDGLLFDREAYESIAGAAALEQIEEYVIRMIEKTTLSA